MKKNILCFFYFLGMCSCFAQDPYFRHFGVEEGLPSSETYDVLQDKRGFVWIATDRGVSRYDGYSFHNFSSADGLTDNTVFKLQQDSAGKIWCGTLNNHFCYFSGDSIFPYAYNTVLETASRNNILQSFSVTDDGEMWVGHQRAGCLQIDAGGKCTEQEPVGNDSNSYLFVSASPGHFIFGSWVLGALGKPGAVQSLYVDVDGKRLQFVLTGIEPSHYLTAVRKKDGTLLVGIGSAVMEIKPDHSYSIHYFDAHVMYVSEDAQGNSWISLNNKGVRQYAAGADLSGSNYVTFLPGETVTDLLQDTEGSYWMSTLAHGVFYMVSANVHCLLPLNTNAGIPVTALVATRNGVLVGTAQGLVHACVAGRIRSTLNCSADPARPEFIQDMYYFEQANATWISTNKRNLCVTAGGEIASMYMDGTPRSITGDSADGYWMGGNIKLQHHTRTGVVYDVQIMLDHRIEEISWDRETGKLLVGRTDGLFFLDSNRFSPFLLAGEKITARVSGIQRTEDHALVIATIGDGIHVLRNGQKYKLSTEQGLCSPIVNDIAADDSGTIWAATNAGIAQVKWATDSFAISCFSVYHGLPTNEIRKILCRNDTIWIGTSAGAAWFVPREIAHPAVAPPTYLEEILVNGEKVNTGVSGNFSYDQNQVRFSFLGISYRNGGSTMYRYRLTGLDAKWTYTTNRSVEFASLSPGDYRFEVMARNGDGTWSAAPASFMFSIRPAFWSQWWFWLVLAAVVASACWWAVQKRLQNIRRTVQQRGILAEYQHQALAAQMNPHFIFNSLSSMQAFILSDEKENALRYVDRFAFLMRKSLEHSMLKYVSLEKEIELLRAYLDIEAMRFGDKLSYSIECEPPLDAGAVEVPAMMVQPFAENAIRHGLLHRESSGGYVHITFTYKDDRAWCRVEDNGVGRRRSHEINRSRRKHIPLGSSITEERLRLLCEVLGQEFSINYIDKESNGIAEGTIVDFLLPSRKRQ